MIYQLAMPGFSGAVSAAVDRAICFYPMPDDPGPTTGANGSKRVYRALEAVEYVRSVSQYDLEGIVVLVTANLASSHTHRLLRPSIRSRSLT